MRKLFPVLIILCFLFACSNPKQNDSTKTDSDSSLAQNKSAGTVQPLPDASYLLNAPEIAIDTFEQVPKKVQKITNLSELNIWGSIDTFLIKRADRMFIRLYVKEAGYVPNTGTESIYCNVIVSVSDYGEYEPNNVFVVGPFLSPVFKTGTDLKDRYIIDVENGYKQHTKLAIYLDKVILE